MAKHTNSAGNHQTLTNSKIWPLTDALKPMTTVLWCLLRGLTRILHPRPIMCAVIRCPWGDSGPDSHGEQQSYHVVRFTSVFFLPPTPLLKCFLFAWAVQLGEKTQKLWEILSSESLGNLGKHNWQFNTEGSVTILLSYSLNPLSFSACLMDSSKRADKSKPRQTWWGKGQLFK